MNKSGIENRKVLSLRAFGEAILLRNGARRGPLQAFKSKAEYVFNAPQKDCRTPLRYVRNDRLRFLVVTLFLASCFLLLTPSFAQNLTVLTHDSFSISEDVIEAFTEDTGIELEFISGGDAGELVNRAILTKDVPLGDVLYGIDNSLLARAQNADIFEPYTSPELENVAEAYRFESGGLVTPIDVGLVNFNYDRAYFEEADLVAPSDLSDLTEEAYAGLSVTQNPTTSSPGLAFMLATIERFGEEGWLEYWAALRDNDLLITAGWNDAYYTAFSLYGGDRPIVLSYATSPAAEVMFAETELDTSPSANLFCEACVYEQIEAVGILKGSQNVEAAQTFIDYMLSETFQADIAPNMFVYPVRSGVAVPETFELYAQPVRNKLPSSSLAISKITYRPGWVSGQP